MYTFMKYGLEHIMLHIYSLIFNRFHIGSNFNTPPTMVHFAASLRSRPPWLVFSSVERVRTRDTDTQSSGQWHAAYKSAPAAWAQHQQTFGG